MNEAPYYDIGLVPVADAFAGTVNTDVYNCEGFHKIEFLVCKGAGATGTSTITVDACDDVTPTNTTAIAFYSRRLPKAGTPAALTARAAAGFVTTAGANEVYEIVVDTETLAGSGYGYIRLTMVESVDSPVTGCVLFRASKLRYEVEPPIAAVT